MCNASLLHLLITSFPVHSGRDPVSSSVPLALRKLSGACLTASDRHVLQGHDLSVKTLWSFAHFSVSNILSPAHTLAASSEAASNALYYSICSHGFCHPWASAYSTTVIKTKTCTGSPGAAATSTAAGPQWIGRSDFSSGQDLSF